MKRTITAKAKSEDSSIKSQTIKVEIEFQYLTQRETKERVERIKNRLHDMLRSDFNHSEIKIQ